PAGPAAQPHGTAQIVDAFQFAQLEDHPVRRPGIEFGGVRGLQSAYVARVFNHHGLHAQADSEIRDCALARVADGVEHAVNAALAEAAGHQDAVVASQLSLPRFARLAFGPDPV